MEIGKKNVARSKLQYQIEAVTSLSILFVVVEGLLLAVRYATAAAAVCQTMEI